MAASHQTSLPASEVPLDPNTQSANSQILQIRHEDSSEEVKLPTVLSTVAESALPLSSALEHVARHSSSHENQSPSTSVSTSSSVIQDLLGELEECSVSVTNTTSAADLAHKDTLGTVDTFPTHASRSAITTEYRHVPFGGPIIGHPHPSTEVSYGVQSLHPNHLPQSCLDRALSLFEQVSSATFVKEAPNTINRTRNILLQNREALEAIHAILACSCSQDGYLVVVISLIMCKILDLYIAAVLPAPSSHLPSSSGHAVLSQSSAASSYLEREFSRQTAAQSVLRELHLVRTPLEQLLSILQTQAAHVERQVEAGALESFSIDMINEPTMPFSASIYDNLALDLAKHLKKLSLDVTNQWKESWYVRLSWQSILQNVSLKTLSQWK